MMREIDEIKYPVGIQSFSEIRNGGYLYVDKTAYILKLLKGKYYFLSRPRRFGKSLFLSTLEAYFLGQRELFTGLSVDSSERVWERYPVLRMDLNNGEYSDPGALHLFLSIHLGEWEKQFEVDNLSETGSWPIGIRFGNLIKKIFEKTGKKVVILVDEYDKPLLNSIGCPEKADEYRNLLKTFYSNLKTMDQYIEFAMLTGVARFSKVSIFSDLNNLRDISFESEYAGICGITGDEVDDYFGDSIEAFAKMERLTRSEVRDELKRRYDGYHFSKKSPDIYNPFSLMNVFAKKEMGAYWFETGTPTFLVKAIRKNGLPLKDVAPITIEAQYLESAGILNGDTIPLLYQSGYLTIKSYNTALRVYTLDYPNEEVKEGFLKALMYAYFPQMKSQSGFSFTDFVSEIISGDVEGFMERLGNMLAGIPYSDKGTPEARFQDAAYLLFTLMGFFTRMEQRTSDGRIDITLETERNVFIFEFKVDSSAEDAIRQIRDKEYWLPYSSSGKEIFLIGADFSTVTRRLSGYVIEKP